MTGLVGLMTARQMYERVRWEGQVVDMPEWHDLDVDERIGLLEVADNASRFLDQFCDIWGQRKRRGM